MQPSVTRDLHVEETTPLITPIDLVNAIPISPKVERTVISGREQVRNILDGQDERLMMVVGPCSIHDEKAALDYAQRHLGV